MKVELPVFGSKAQKIADYFNLEKSGTKTGRNTRVYFTYQSIEGHPKIIVELEI